MENHFYYFDTFGNDDKAYIKALEFACNLVKDNQDLTKIKFLVSSSKNMGWLERIFGEKIAKQMLKEEQEYKGIPLKIKTLKT